MQVTNNKSNKDIYFTDIKDKKENHELKRVFKKMKEKEFKMFNCHDIAEILGGGTNIASRVFKRLEINGLIKSCGNHSNNVTNKKIAHYIVKKDAIFNINKNTEKKAKDLYKYKKQIQDIISCLCASNSKIEEKHIIRTMSTLTNILIKLQNNYEIEEIRVVNAMSGKDDIYVDAKVFLEQYSNIYKNLN